VSRPRWLLRDAALGYASRGISVLPLHYPLPLQSGRLQPVTGHPQPAGGSGCSCRDPGCGQVAKHPLGSLVPHGVNDATTNRARILAWWTRHPQANIGLATGHRFDVLDVDSPTGAHAIQELAATHSLHSSGPLVRTGGGGWHYYLAPTGLGNAQPRDLEHVDWRGRGGYVIAPPSRHASGHPYQWVPGRDLETPLAEIPAPLRARLEHRAPQRSVGSVEFAATGADLADRYARAALAQELARVATAPVGHRNRQLWESTRNLYNLVATGALNHREVDHALLAAAERCGLLQEEPRQTHRSLASGRQVGLAHPGRPRQPSRPERTHASPILPARAAGERTKEGR
jgi:Bifunctional DNA primase/polymerase, N-terminal